MAIQWHPLFAFLLRQVMEDYYEVLTNLPVGDVPREADIALVRRTSAVPPFQGLWKHLTVWNVIEYKGPSVSARLDHIDLLVELGLGIHRRLNQEGGKKRRRHVPPHQVSFWYIVSRLTERFFAKAGSGLGAIEKVSDGIWRSSILDRPLYLVSGKELPVEYDSMPLHVLGVDSAEKEQAAARLIIEQPALWDIYSQFMGSLHETTLKELIDMARASNKGPKLRIKWIVDLMGMKNTIDQIGKTAVLEHFASDPKTLKEMAEFSFSRLSDADRAKLMRPYEDHGKKP